MIRVTSHDKQYFINFQHTEIEQPVAGFKQADMTIARRYAIVTEALKLAANHPPSAIELVKAAAQRAIEVLDFLPGPTHCTVCKISAVQEHGFPVTLVLGESFTAPGDNFCRETGRWWSLTRALEQLAALGLEAGDFQAAYFSRGTWAASCPRLDEVARYSDWYDQEYVPNVARLAAAA